MTNPTNSTKNEEAPSPSSSSSSGIDTQGKPTPNNKSDRRTNHAPRVIQIGRLARLIPSVASQPGEGEGGGRRKDARWRALVCCATLPPPPALSLRLRSPARFVWRREMGWVLEGD